MPADSREAVGTEARWWAGVLALAVGLLAANLSTPAALADGRVDVLYAGSLVNQMKRGVEPAFDKTTGAKFQGYAGGSFMLANQIKSGLRQGDVLISANPKVNNSLMGAANGDRVNEQFGVCK